MSFFLKKTRLRILPLTLLKVFCNNHYHRIPKKSLVRQLSKVIGERWDRAWPINMQCVKTILWSTFGQFTSNMVILGKKMPEKISNCLFICVFLSSLFLANGADEIGDLSSIVPFFIFQWWFRSMYINNVFVINHRREWERIQLPGTQ